jgi:hypothetical protein
MSYPVLMEPPQQVHHATDGTGNGVLRGSQMRTWLQTDTGFPFEQSLLL